MKVLNVNGYEIKSGANLRGATLQDADLRGAALRYANLQGADLQGAILQDADLQGATLQDAILRGARLRNADLRDTDLRDTDLRDADLRNANLQGATLQDADLRGACYSVIDVLRAQWDFLPDHLITELMKWDAHATPRPSKFMKWKKGLIECPAAQHLRIFFFKENRDLFRAGKPTMTLWELWEAIADATGIKI